MESESLCSWLSEFGVVVIVHDPEAGTEMGRCRQLGWVGSWPVVSIDEAAVDGIRGEVVDGNKDEAWLLGYCVCKSGGVMRRRGMEDDVDLGVDADGARHVGW